jgi:hypothetical protein
MVKIRFTAQGSNALIGGFSSGDQANVGEPLAKHLVEEARVAAYVASPAPAAPKHAARKPKSAVPPAPTSES